MTTPPAVAAGFAWWTETGLVKVMRDDPPGEERAIRLHAARGEVEWAQVIVRSAEDGEAVFKVGELAGAGRSLPADHVRFHPAVYVHVAQPTGNRVRVPADWPEVLPEGDRCHLPAGRNQAMYVQVTVPPDTPPGSYRGSITMHVSGAEPVAIPLSLTVWPITLPQKPTQRTSYYIWWDGIEQRFHLQDDPARRQQVFDRFFYFLLERRLCPMILPVDIAQADRYMADPRVNGVRLPYTDDDAEMRRMIEHVTTRGWRDRTYFYLYDEPARHVWPELIRSAKRVMSFDPLMPRLNTIQPVPELAEHVTIWCPNVENLYLHEAEIAAARARGEEVWWYTAVVPKWPYPTFLLDDDAIAPRLLFWLQARYDLTGSMYINTIHWGPPGHDPWQDAVVSMPELANNNDGLLMYSGRGPDEAFPVTGVRLEMIRDGIEDVELLHILRDTVADAAGRLGMADPEGLARAHIQALASRIVPDARHSRRDPAALQSLRRRAAHQIRTLQNDYRQLERLLDTRLRTVDEPGGLVADDKFAVALPGTPVLDGRLDDACWQKAQAANAPGLRTIISRFRTMNGRIWPSVGTSVMAVYDEENIYFAFQCSEEAASLRFYVEEGELDAADRVGLAILHKDGIKWLVVTADGALFEGDGGRLAPVRNPAWQAGCQVLRTGYTVEIAVPRELLADPHAPRFNIFRHAPARQEVLYFTARFGTRNSPRQLGTLWLMPPEQAGDED